MKDSKPTLYIDCTSTYITGLNTGIQRVVRNIVNRAKDFEEKYNYIGCPVVIIDGQFFKFEFSVEAQYGKGKTALPNQIKSSLERLKHQFSQIFFVGPILKFFFESVVFAGRLIYKVMKRFRLKKLKKTHTPVSKFDENSCVVFLDAFWDKNSVSGFQKAKDEAGSVISVMYDIIPITHPQFLEVAMTGLFTTALKKVSYFSDGFMSISNSVKRNLIDYFYSEKLHRDEHRYDYFHLGSDFKVGSVKEADVRDTIKTIFDGEEIWLIVGTLEPRKNHILVVLAFEEYIAKGSKAKLIILGWVGWKADNILSKIISAASYGRQIFMFTNASDSELEYCYSHCHGLFFASFTEGFGLPLVEAMQRKLKVIASDIPVFREIGGIYPQYFNPHSVESLIKALIDSHNIKDGDPSQSVLISWNQSADQFYRKVLQLHADITETKKNILKKAQSNIENSARF